MNQSDIFHYPPDLFQLLIDTIPLLNRSKIDVVIFFQGAGVPNSLLNDIRKKVEIDRDSINKYEIARQILTKINEKTDTYIRERRELLKRVTEFEAFSTLWESDQYKAKGLVSDIRDIIQVKDSFTRMQQERDKEAQKNRVKYENEVQIIRKKKEQTEAMKKDFYALFSETNAQARGLKLEIVLNKLFDINGISIREAFRRRGESGDGIIEQIDGVVEIENRIYFVEMKWRKDNIGIDDIYAHLGRIYHRSNAQGIYISASGYTPASIIAAKEAMLKNGLLVLCDLEEFVKVLETERDLTSYLRQKIHAAILDKEPFFKPT